MSRHIYQTVQSRVYRSDSDIRWYVYSEYRGIEANLQIELLEM